MLESPEHNAKSAFADFLEEFEATDPVTRFLGDLIEGFIERGIDPLQSDNQVAGGAIGPGGRRLTGGSAIGADGVKLHTLCKLCFSEGLRKMISWIDGTRVIVGRHEVLCDW